MIKTYAVDDPIEIEVSRKAYELSHTHGWTAHSYAAKCAEAALAEGKTDEYEFWKRVEARVTPNPREASMSG
jgi:hypothetical protein